MRWVLRREEMSRQVTNHAILMTAIHSPLLLSIDQQMRPEFPFLHQLPRLRTGPIGTPLWIIQFLCSPVMPPRGVVLRQTTIREECTTRDTIRALSVATTVGMDGHRMPVLRQEAIATHRTPEPVQRIHTNNHHTSNLRPSSDSRTMEARGNAEQDMTEDHSLFENSSL